jgi:hypothetical protein
MNLTCPRCEHEFSPGPQNQPAPGADTTACPACAEAVPLAPPGRPRPVAPLRDAGEPDAVPAAPAGGPAPPAWLRLRRVALLLGSAALLVLGAVVYFLAAHRSAETAVVARNIVDQQVLNEHFRNLIASGRATEADLAAVAAVEAFGNCFIGLSRDALPWAEAEASAARAGGGILDLAEVGVARAAIVAWLGRAHPDTLGKTTWISDGGRPMVIDSPDLGEVSTHERPRRAFIFWPGKMPTGWAWSIGPRFDEALPFEACGLARVRVGKLWGLVDKAGRDLLAPAFDAIGAFSEHGCARVTLGDRAGLVDQTGAIIVKPEWEDVQDRINGFVPVKRAGKWGYLDSKGAVVIACEWDDAWRFSAEGFAVVTRDGKRGLIDRSGKLVVAAEWDGALNFCKEGIGALRRGGDWALVAANGRLLTEPVWRVWLAGNRLGWDDRRPDLGWIPVHGADGFTLLGLDGRPLVDGAFEGFQSSKAGAILTRADGGSFLFGKDGRELLRFRGRVSPAREGLLRVENGGEFGFLGEDGTWKLPLRRGEARDFAGGLAAFSKDGKWGFIGPDGTTIVRAQWDEVREFREDCAAVRRGDRWGFVNRSGKTIAAPKWEVAGDFSCGRAAVAAPPASPAREPEFVALSNRARQGDADAQDQLRNLTPEQRVEMTRQLQQHARAANQRNWTFIDASGRTVFEIPPYGIYGTPSFRDGRLRRYGYPHLDPDGRPLDPAAPTAATGPEGLALQRVGRAGGYHDRHANAGLRFDLANTFGGLVMTGANPKADFNDPFIPHAEPAKYGLMDAAGRVLAEPRWDELRILPSAWVWIGQAGKCGILGAGGQVVLEPEWDEVRAISPDWLWLRRGAKCGLADATGRIVVGPEWDEAEVLPVRSAGSAAEAGAGRGAERLFSPWLRVRSGGRSVILRGDGRPALPEQMHAAQFVDFYGPRQLVIVEDAGGERLWSLYDPASGAKTSFPDAKSLAWNWRGALEGVLWIEDKNDGRWRLLRETGEAAGLVLAERPASWDLRPGGGAGDGAGLAARRPMVGNRIAFEKDGKWGFTDGAGTLVCAPQWDTVRDFSFGRAAVKAGSVWGFIDEAGATVVAPAWDEVKDFGWPWRWEAGQEGAEEHAFVRSNQNWALVARDGSLIAGPKYSLARPLRAGGVIELARRADRVVDLIRRGPDGTWQATPRNWPGYEVTRISPERGWRYQAAGPGRYHWALVDETGTALTPYEWGHPGASPEVDAFAQGLIRARNPDGRLGLIASNGRMVLAPRFDRIAWVALGAAAAWSPAGGGLIDTQGQWRFQDNDRIRIARFTTTASGPARNRESHGLVVLEDQPKWGYAKLVSGPPAAPE